MRARDYALVVGVIAALVAFHGLRTGQLDRRLAARDSVISDLTSRARQTDTIYVRDTVRFRETVTRWRTLTDTLTLTERESVIVAAADTAIRACSIALGTCEQRVAQRDSTILLLHAQVRDLSRAAAGCRVMGIPCPVWGPGVVTDGTSVRPGVAVIIPIGGR